MNSKIVLVAQKFCADYLCDNSLTTENYMIIIDEYLDTFESLKDKVGFLIEIKRIGTLFIANAQKQVKEQETFKLSKAEFSMF